MRLYDKIKKRKEVNIIMKIVASDFDGTLYRNGTITQEEKKQLRNGGNAEIFLGLLREEIINL